MKKRIMAILLCVVMLVGVLPATGFAESGVDILGTGASDDPYLIYTATGLKEFRDKINGENGQIKQSNAHAKLMNDIVLNDGTFDENGNYTKGASGKAAESWEPIGWKTDDGEAPYSGTFDGNGKTVSGLNVKDVQYAGLFGTLNNATVKNVAVTGDIAASGTGTNAYAGAIAAYATGSTTITGCKNYATVTTTTVAGVEQSVFYEAYAGGTVGYATGSVALTDCVNNGAVLSTIRNNDDFSVQAYIGGIAGTADGNIRFDSCVNNGALSTDCKSAESNIGGIVGCAIGGAVIADCQNNGAVTGAVDHSEDPDIYYMYYTTVSNAGGIVGCGVAIRITGCHNSGAIRSDSTGNYPHSTRIGGIAGFIKSDAEKAAITDCSNVATVTGTNPSSGVRAGGIMGFVNSYSADVSFTNCYSTGAVSAASPKSDIGGIAGDITESFDGGNIVIDNCYWLTGTVESAVGYNIKGLPVNASSKSAADFANGTVLALLKGDRTDSPWAKTDYLAAAGLTLPLLNWQTADSHTHTYEWTFNDTEHWKVCHCGVIEAGSVAAHSGGEATCTEKATCEVCGEKYGDKNADNHSGTEGWVAVDDATHKNVWACCGKTSVWGEHHTWHDGNCLKCGYGCVHQYKWKSANGKYWEICKLCDFETAKKSIPEITLVGADKVCRTQSYTFTFAFSEGVADAYYGYEFLGLGGDHIAPAVDGASYSGKINASAYPAEENSFKLVVSGETADGFVFSAEKTVTIQNEHTGGMAACTEKATCDICGEKYGNLNPNNHTGTSEWIQTETAHEKKYTCCGANEVAKENHEWENGVCSECGYTCTHKGGEATCLEKATCDICGEKYGNLNPNNHTGTSEWIQTETAHEKKYTCCGANEVAKENHEWENGVCSECGYTCTHKGGEATCLEKATCDICGEKYGNLNANNHTGTSEWITTETTHEKKYTCCGANEVAKENHEWENGACIECGYNCTHKGGEATCTEKAVCDICGEKYGNLNANNHTGTSEWIQTETTHEKKYTCCGANEVAKENHEWENGACSECGYNCTHKGGEATCLEKATCDICGEKYGNLNANNHTGTLEWITTETTHEKKYTCCGANEVAKENHEWENGVCIECGYGCTHKGGEATCTEKAVCDICGNEYGDLKEHSYSNEWTSNDTEHWHECASCGDKADTAEHADENKDHKCDLCEKTLSEHSGGKATCKEQAICELCGEKYGEIDPDCHTGTAEWIISADSHEQKYNCCGAVITAKEAHEFKDGVCTKCGYKEVKPANPDSTPATGDALSVEVFIILAILSSGVLIFSVTHDRKKRRKSI